MEGQRKKEGVGEEEESLSPYKGSKYWFSLAKTSSDKKRSGKNLTSDITKTLSVYKK